MWHMWEERCMQGFGGETWGKQQLGRPERRWDDIIKMCLQETEWEGVSWIDLAQNMDIWQTLVNMVMNLQVS
jgi:hypothetical protein